VNTLNIMLQTLKSLKTPLRYPGGKSRALPKIFQYIPDLKNFHEFREPFIGGGSVALEVTKRYPGIQVWVNDLYNPLYTFWSILRDEPKELHRCIKDYKEEYNTPELARQLFNEMKIQLNHPEAEDFYRAVAFYILNKCSFSGLTESSSFSAQASVSNFSMNNIEKIPEYGKLIKDWYITNWSYEDMLTDQKNVFVYLDPPYDIKDNLYGSKGSMHKGFDHDKFAADCDRFICPQLVSYNNSNLVKERFQGWTVGEFAHTYTMRSVGSYNTDQASRHELVLFNYEV
jgi:DNA adenine methylase